MIEAIEIKKVEAKGYIMSHMPQSFRKHVLTRAYCSEDEKFQVWVMQKPGTRNMKVQLTFSPEGIAIQGDVGLGPNQHGLLSNPGYGIGWFGSYKSQDYLCEKFLRSEFVVEEAAEEIEGWLKDPDSYGWEFNDEQKEGLAEIVNGLRGDDWYGQARFHDELEELNIHCDDGTPGWGYNRADAGWLCAIQEAFVRLYEGLGRQE